MLNLTGVRCTRQRLLDESRFRVGWSACPSAREARGEAAVPSGAPGEAPALARAAARRLRPARRQPVRERCHSTRARGTRAAAARALPRGRFQTVPDAEEVLAARALAGMPSLRAAPGAADRAERTGRRSATAGSRRAARMRSSVSAFPLKARVRHQQQPTGRQLRRGGVDQPVEAIRPLPPASVSRARRVRGVRSSSLSRYAGRRRSRRSGGPRRRRAGRRAAPAPAPR